MACKYCFEETSEKLISPCKCNGTLKYVHASCLRRWCDVNNNSITNCRECGFEFVRSQEYYAFGKAIKETAGVFSRVFVFLFKYVFSSAFLISVFLGTDHLTAVSIALRGCILYHLFLENAIQTSMVCLVFVLVTGFGFWHIMAMITYSFTYFTIKEALEHSKNVKILF